MWITRVLTYRSTSINKSAIHGSRNVNCFKENHLTQYIASGCLNEERCSVARPCSEMHWPSIVRRQIAVRRARFHFLLATFCAGLPIRGQREKNEPERRDGQVELRVKSGGREREREKETEADSVLILWSRHESWAALYRCILTFFLALSNVIKPEAGTISLEKALSGNSTLLHRAEARRRKLKTE